MPVLTTPDAPLSPAEAKAAVRIVANVDAAKVGVDLGLTPDQEKTMGVFAGHTKASREREALTTLATGFAHESTWKETAKGQIQTDFDPNTGERKPRSTTTNPDTEAKRYDATEKHTQKYLHYLTYGIDGLDRSSLPQAEKDEIKVMVRGVVSDVIKANPGLLSALESPSGSGAILTSTIDGILRDRKVMNMLAERLNGAYDPNRIPKDIENQMLEAMTHRGEAERAVDVLVKKEADLTQERADKEKDKKSYETDSYSSTSGMGGTSMEAVRGQLSQDTDVMTHIKLQEAYDALLKQYGPGHGRVKDAKKEVDDHLKVGNNKDKVSEYSFLTQKKESIDGQLSKIITELDSATAALKTTIDVRTTAQVAHINVVSHREALSKQFFDDIEGALAKAVGEHLTKEATDFLASYRVTEIGVVSDVAAQHADATKKQLDSRYVISETKKDWLGREVKVMRINKTNAQGDYATLITGGPDSVIGKILDAAGVNEEERGLLLKDQSFMEARRAEVAAKTMAAYVSSGGNVDAKTIDAMMLTSWGKDMFVDNEAAKKFLQDTKSNNLTNGTTPDLYKKYGKKGFYALLMAVLGIASAATSLTK